MLTAAIMDMFPELLILVLFVAIIVAVVASYISDYKKAKKNLTEKNAEDNSDDEFSDDEEPEVVELHGCITHKECYSGMTSSVRHPHAYKNFVINFRSDDGEEHEYDIDEETYLSIEEGDFGYVAVVGERFYGYCSDKDAETESEE